MLRGLDGYLLILVEGLASFAVFKLRRGRAGGLSPFSVVIARGRHLFPFRTEQLSPSAPMVLGLRGPGRVGRRRITSASGPSREPGRPECFRGPRSRAGLSGGA